MNQTLLQVLLVDDDEDQYILLREMLSKANLGTFHVEWNSSYASGLEALKTGAFEVVLVDYVLGAKSGVDFIREAVSAGYPAPLILLSGQGGYKVDLEAMQAGAADYMEKGELSTAVLERAIRYAIEHKQTERNLRESEEYYKTLFYNRHSPMLLIDPESFQIADANEAASAYYGWSLDELLGMKITDINLLPPEQVHKEMGMAQGSSSSKQFYFRHRLANGEIREVEVHSGPLHIKGKDLLFSTIQDITERIQTETALKKSEERFRNLFEGMTEGFALHEIVCNEVGKPIDYRFLEINPSFERLTGLKREGVIGQLMSVVLPNDNPDWVQIYGDVALTGKPIHFEDFSSALKRHFDLFAYSPAPGQFATLFLDITERKHMEQALQASEQQFRVLFHNTPLASILYHLDRNAQGEIESWRIRDINDKAADNLFRPAQELIGKRADELFSKEFLTPFDELTQTVLETERPMQFETLYPAKDKHFLSTLFSVGPDLFANVSVDITDRMLAEKALQEERNQLARRVEERTAELSRANAELIHANRTKDEFLSTMSHELRTPLNAILGLSESLEEGVYGSMTPKQVETLRTINESGQHLLELITDILDFSKVESGRMDLQPGPVDLEAVCQSALRLVKAQASQKHLRTVTNLESEPGTLVADERRLRQMLVNLLMNAVKFTPEGGQIGLEVDRIDDGDTIRFTVWDTGIGIPEDKLGMLFKPFIQLDSALSRQYSGTGLGLALVRRLAEMHGGSVGVESNPGEGSRFWFTIPVIQTLDTGSQTLPASLNTTQGVSAPRRVLMIEDSAQASEQISRYLRELNIQVIIRPVGSDAVKAASLFQPDLILLDILLPDTSGWHVLSELKTDPHTHDIPVIIVSVVDERMRGQQGGAAEYLVKPITREQLHGVVKKAIAPQNQASSLRHANPAPGASQTENKKALILIAEDNLANLNSLSDYLNAKGYRLVLALNGYEAIERSLEFKPDLILMDIQMPSLDGLEATRRLRAMPEFATTPIIALTALTMPGDRERCLEAGADSYMVKPVSLKELMKEIDSLLVR